MKVLFDAHAAIEKKTGIGRYSDNLISLLSKKPSLNISLYSNLSPSKIPGEYRKYPAYFAPFRNGVFRIFWGFIQASKKLKPDIIHVSYFAPILKTTLIVNTVHDVCFKTCPKKYPIKTRFIFKIFFPYSLWIADKIICVSEATKKSLKKQYRVPEEKIVVIHEACSNIFKYISDKKLVKKQLKDKFNIDKRYFMVVGNIEKRKKPHEILAAYKKFAQSDKKTQLVFVGPQKLSDFPPEEAEEMIQEGQLKILDYVADEDLNLLYNGASGLIYLSCCEGFGLPLVEAMECQTPIICSNLPVMKEVVAGAAVVVNNQKELITAMKSVLSNSKLRQKLIQKGKERAKIFSWKKTANETYKVYKSLVKI